MTNPQTGLTLIEVLVTLAVAAILIVVAIPSFQNMTKSNRLTTSVNDLVYALNLARSEALKSGSASVCPSNDQQTCSDNGSWTDGWIVFSDLNSNCTVDAGEAVIQVTEKLASTISIGASITPAGAGCISYNNSGFLSPVGSTVNFHFCDQTIGRQLNIITTGRPSTTSYGNCPTV